MIVQLVGKMPEKWDPVNKCSQTSIVACFPFLNLQVDVIEVPGEAVRELRTEV